MAETITADMVIHDVVTKYPATVKVFHGHGLPCTACAVGSRESVAEGRTRIVSRRRSMDCWSRI